MSSLSRFRILDYMLSKVMMVSRLSYLTRICLQRENLSVITTLYKPNYKNKKKEKSLK